MADPDTPQHDPELIAVLTAAATAALGQAVRVTDAKPLPPPPDPEAKDPS